MKTNLLEHMLNKETINLCNKYILVTKKKTNTCSNSLLPVWTLQLNEYVLLDPDIRSGSFYSTNTAN